MFGSCLSYCLAPGSALSPTKGLRLSTGQLLLPGVQPRLISMLVKPDTDGNQLHAESHVFHDPDTASALLLPSVEFPALCELQPSGHSTCLEVLLPPHFC